MLLVTIDKIFLLPDIFIWFVVKSIYLQSLNPFVVKWLLNVALVFETGHKLLNVACAFDIIDELKDITPYTVIGTPVVPIVRVAEPELKAVKNVLSPTDDKACNESLNKLP